MEVVRGLCEMVWTCGEDFMSCIMLGVDVWESGI